MGPALDEPVPDAPADFCAMAFSAFACRLPGRTTAAAHAIVELLINFLRFIVHSSIVGFSWVPPKIRNFIYRIIFYK
jgi:hypothetical protein